VVFSDGFGDACDCEADGRVYLAACPVCGLLAGFPPDPDAGGYQQCDDDRVALLDFAAQRDGDGVRVSWVTGSEVACVLFEVLRCDLTSGECPIERHAAIPGLSQVPCVNSLAGASYAVRDAGAPMARGFSYLLREHETTGARVHYGPLRLAVGVREVHWTPAEVPPSDGSAPPAEVPATAGGGCATTQVPAGALTAAAALLAVVIARRARAAFRRT
jgi:hypothetical protein